MGEWVSCKRERGGGGCRVGGAWGGDDGGGIAGLEYLVCGDYGAGRAL